MRPLLNVLFFCCRDSQDKDSTVISIKDSNDLEKIEKSTNDIKSATQELSNKEIENNSVGPKSNLKIRKSRQKPSIVLSIDGASEPVVLFEDQPKKKKKAKGKKSKKKRSKDSKNPVAP